MTDRKNNDDDLEVHGAGTSSTAPVEEDKDPVVSRVGEIFGKVKRGWDEYTADVRVADDPASSDSAGDEPAAPAPRAEGVSIVRRGRDVASSFLDGLKGRKHGPATPGRHGSGFKLAFKIVVGIFAVLGALATVSAVLDAFKSSRH